MNDDETVTTLVRRAAEGEESAWRTIVTTYSPLVRSVCRRHGLRDATADDICGTVWLRLVGALETIRQPAALPGWLATSARRECLQHLRRRTHERLTADLDTTARATVPCDVALLADERCVAVRAAVARLSRADQHLLALLFSDPPTPYATISTRLGMPVGAIGPTRQRCLTRMRRYPALAALLRP